MAQAEDKKRNNLIIAGVVIVLVIVMAAGLLAWALSSRPEEKAQTGSYATVTPGSDAAGQQVGQLSVQPTALAMQPTPDGRFGATATVSALFQDFTADSVRVNGDPRIVVKTDCPQSGDKLKAGHRCQVQLTLDPNSMGGAQATTTQPTLEITGSTLTPGGSKQPVDATAAITGVEPGKTGPVQPGSTLAGTLPGGAPGSGTPLASGAAAPNGIDPYGPVNPNSAPVTYTPQAGAAAQQRVLSPREQFILARRQAVLGNVVRDQQQAPSQPKGDWDEIGVQKAVSSLPQDMSRVVTMDRVITAVLMRTYDSRQSQQVVAQVDRNVYGAADRNVLVPRGSTIIGTAAGGAERIGIVWTQIIRPDGARFVFQGQGGDAMGQSGVPGRINNRYLKRIGAGLLGTVLKVSTALATSAKETPNQGTTVSTGSAAATGAARNNGAIVTDIVTQDINSILAPIIQQAQAIQAVVTVPAGTRMTIMPTQDLVMREIQRPVVVRQQYPRQMNGGAAITGSPYQAPEGAEVDATGGAQQRARQSGRQTPQNNVVARGIANGGTAVPAGNTPPWGSN